MKIKIEDSVPYHRSILWQIHDAYFAQRGLAAWTAGDIPYAATCNFAMARQHAFLAIEVVRELVETGTLSEKGPVEILEVGSGSGEFAANFLGTLETGCGKAGRALAGRLRYLLSDYSLANLRQAIERKDLSPAVRSGRVVPALLDMREPEIRDVASRPMNVRPAIVLANYVCCILPPRVLRKTKNGFEEKRVTVVAEAPPGKDANPHALLQRLLKESLKTDLIKGLDVTYDWKKAPLEETLPDPVHRNAFLATVAGFEEATVAYPLPFLDFVRGLRPQLHRNALLLLNDFGNCLQEDLEGLGERRPVHYGNTNNHAVDFAVFDPFCASQGLGLLRTRRPLQSVHSAAIRYSPEMSLRFRRAFKETHMRCQDGQDLVDWKGIARKYAKDGEHKTAALIWERCLRLDPRSPEILFELGRSLLAAGLAPRALRYFKRGLHVDNERSYDFLFELGRTYTRVGRYEDARKVYLRAVERENHPATHANLGIVFEELGDYEKAFACYQRALAEKPDNEVRELVLRRLADTGVSGEEWARWKARKVVTKDPEPDAP